ncbi:hypothetical protein C5S39_13105, partial [Candidatus Methanophagaceae archaeon]
DKSYFSRNYPLEVFFLFVPENINAAIGLIMPLYATSGSSLSPL